MSDELKKGIPLFETTGEIVKSTKEDRDMIETLKRYLKRQEYLKRISLLRK
jgi:hypothetical protein